MISNVILLYIHLRLLEIFNTGDDGDGWFEKIHILLFGDLMQLPPVHEDPPFVTLSKAKIKKYNGAMGTFNLWSLFTYDELTINMRQQGDHTYRDILSKIRTAILTEADMKIQETRKIKLQGNYYQDKIQHLCNYIDTLPTNTICLFPTCDQCDTLDSAMLSRIPFDEIKLTAIDTFECSPNLKTRPYKLLKKMKMIIHELLDLPKSLKLKLEQK